MKKLDYFVNKDERIKKVYTYAKQNYKKNQRPQHNWCHILRDLYRCLVIADVENDVNYNILIPSVLLHDIGYFQGEFSEHDLVGKEMVNKLLPDFGYEKKEIKEIAHCIASHGGKEEPKTKEAKILFDADKLEKSGIGGAFTLYRAQLELGIPIKKFIEWIIIKMEKFNEEGFYTQKATEMSQDGFNEYLEHLGRVKESLESRKDFLVSEKDLWE